MTTKQTLEQQKVSCKHKNKEPDSLPVGTVVKC